jgi:PncC family amidohydrolase
MSIAAAARKVAQALKTANLKVVFAESCTGGMVSGALTRVPGISAHHCGGVVVYRNETKEAYLGIPVRLLENPGPVSPEVTQLLAENVLEKTPEADLALAITGHLGPHAPPRLDGHVFIAVASRLGRHGQKPKTTVKHQRCTSSSARLARQRWAVERALAVLAHELEALAR